MANPEPAEGSVPVTAPMLARDRSTDTRRILNSVFRVYAASKVEGDVALAASESQSFVRGFEFAPVDAGILIIDRPDLPTSLSDRFYTLYEQLLESPAEVVLPIDIKSFAYRIKYNERAGRYLATRAAGVIPITRAQWDHAQAFIIASIAEPEWVAFLPMCYFAKGAAIADKIGNRELSCGMVPPTMQAFSPLPPLLAPFVMPREMLPLAIDNFAACARDSTIKMANPFSGLEYHHAVQPSPSTFTRLVRVDNSEHSLRYRIWKAFRDEGSLSGYKVLDSLYSPCGSDIRFDHEDGASIFVELKSGMVRIERAASGRTKLLHMQHFLNRFAIFTFKAPWDYLLTFVDEDEGYLICKDDIPRSFWHADPGIDKYLVEEFLDDAFLNAHRVGLADASQFVRDVARILRGTHSISRDDPPYPASLTPEDIVEFAGPCPKHLLVLPGEVRPEDLEIEEAEVVVENPQDAADEDPREAETAEGSNFVFTNVQVASRQLINTGLSSEYDAQLFLALIKQCRYSGQGVVLDLGKYNPFGRLGFINWVWSPQEKKRFDDMGVAPCWVGMLKSSEAMVVMNVMQVRWRLHNTPDEPTPGVHKQCLASHPCVMVCTPYPRELSNNVKAQWVVPSEFLPKFHLASITKPNRPGLRTKMYMENGIDIERFTVSQWDIHGTLTQFLAADKEKISIGDGGVEVDPRPYRKSVGEYKRTGDIHFDQAFYLNTRPRT